MLAYNKIFLVILYSTSLIFSSRFAFAQNMDNLKLDIYPKLRDKRCTTMSLDKCNCPEAREMKAYIDGLIEAGVKEDDIFYKVAKKFSLNTILDEQVKTQVEKRLIKEAGHEHAQIILENNSFDFGKVSKKQGKIHKGFKLYNKGRGKLTITNIKASCSCVTASLIVHENKSPDFGTQGVPSGWQEIIEPGENGELEVVVDLGHPSISIGKLTRNIDIASNDPINPEVTLKITADVQD